MNRDDLGKVIVATGEDIDSIEWEDPLPGVHQKVLWQSGDTTLGIMKVDEGHENPEHAHHAAHHHILVLEGECTMLGRRVGPGAYVYVPPTVPHAVTDVGTGGCTFFYTYRPLEVTNDVSPLHEHHGGVV